MSDVPCQWPLALADCDTTRFDSLSESTRAMVTDMAVEFLWRMTGRQFGVCPEQIYPYHDSRGVCDVTTNHRSIWHPYMLRGRLHSSPCWGRFCRCSDPSGFPLPADTHQVTSVKIGEEIFTDWVTEITVGGGKLLLRLDGEDWPQEDWSMTLELGTPVPIGGQVAAGVLAEEMAMMLCNDSKCRLPKHIQSVARQGVVTQMFDDPEMFTKARTGIWIIDSWVSSIMVSPSPSTVRSPDTPKKWKMYR